MEKKYSLKRIIFIITFLPLFLILLFIVWNSLSEYKNITRETEKFKKDLIERNKEQVKLDVLIIKKEISGQFDDFMASTSEKLSRLNYLKLKNLNNQKISYIYVDKNDTIKNMFNYKNLDFDKIKVDTLQQLNHNMKNIFLYKYNYSSDRFIVVFYDFYKSREWRSAKKFINKINLELKDSYIFVMDNNGVLRVHVDKTFVGKSIKNYIDDRGESVYEILKAGAYKSNSGSFVSYRWMNPSSKKIDAKNSFVMSCKKLDIIIGAGFYDKNLTKIISTYAEKVYSEKRKGFIFYLLFFLFILFFILFAYLLFLNFIGNEFNEFNAFFKEGKNNKKIDIEKLRIKEFFGLGEIANEMIADKIFFEETLKKYALTDSLTNLNNRRSFMDILNNKFAYAKRYDVELSLLYFDIDYFKDINDTYGHECGDLVLKKLSSIVLKNIRVMDVAGRIGGEEFGVILLNTDKDKAFEIAERLRESVEKTIFKYNDDKVDVTISVGVAILTNETTAEEFLVKSDKYMYQAKKNGRNRICCDE